MPRTPKRVLSLCIGLACTLAAPTTHAVDQQKLISQLLVQGHFWYQRGRPDLTKAAWEKVLRADPDNREALAGLRELGSIDLSKLDYEKLKLARELARQGKYEESLSLYLQAFNGKPPTSYLRAEYLLTQSNSETGWKNAETELRELVEIYPSHPYYALSLAKLKTYREDTRPEGIEMLETLITDENFGEDALEAWRQALLWTTPSPKNRSLFSKYLQQRPDDQAILNQLNNIDNPPPSPIEIAYSNLNASKYSAAKASFEAIIAENGNDADAHEGLGMTYLGRKQFGKAILHLSRAMKLSPDKTDRLNSLLDEANYWQTFNQAKYATEKNRLKQAAQLTRKAISMRPKQTEGLLLFASIETLRKNLTTAVEYYEKVLETDPKNKIAKKGMTALLPNIEDEKKIESLITKYNLPDKEYRTIKNQRHAIALLEKADKTTNRKKEIALVEQAYLKIPNNPWVTLRLARMYRDDNREPEARSILNKLVSDTANNPDSHYAKALYHNEDQQWQLGLDSINAIPADKRNDEIEQLHLQLWGRRQHQIALPLIANDNLQPVRKIINALYEKNQESGGNAEIMLIHADLLGRTGESRAAAFIAKKAGEKIGEDRMDLQIEYLTLLLNLGNREMMRTALNKLIARSPELTPEQHASIERLELGLALQTAESLRAQGNYKDAYQVLVPLQEQFTNDIDYKLLLANIYKDNGNSEQALKLYQEILAKEPERIDVHVAASGTAMSLREFEQSLDLTEAGLKRAPDRPELLVMSGQLNWMLNAFNAAHADVSRALKQRDAYYAEQKSTYPTLEKVSSKDTPWPVTAQKLLNDLEELKETSLTVGGEFRFRDGQNGLNHITQYATPIKYRKSLDYERYWGFAINPVTIDAGTPSSTAFLATQPLNASENPDQETQGTALSGYYHDSFWDIDLGFSPLGFNQENLVGGIKYSLHAWYDDFSIGLSRRTVEDSLLSWAGSTDAATNLDWGGVTRTGIKIELDRGLDNHGYYSTLGYYWLDGKNVENNNEIDLLAGTYFQIYDSEQHSAQIGANINYRKFDKNLSAYTFGHGGYFSPQDYLAVTFPLSYTVEMDNLDYQFGLDLGYQVFSEDASPVFPTRGDFQQQLENNAIENPFINTYIGENEASEFIYTVKGSFNYDLNTKLTLSGRISTSRSENYQETMGGIYLKYHFE